MVGNKVKEYKNLTEIWTKNRDKDEFLKYVRDNVAAYQKSESKTAMKREADGVGPKGKLIPSDRAWWPVHRRHLGTDDALR